MAELGFKVLLIEWKSWEKIGDKVCGDAIGIHHFKKLNMKPPEGEGLANEVKGIELYSPDGSTVFKLEGEGVEGFIVNRKPFGLRILKEAMDAGTVLMEGCKAIDLIIKDGYAVGVKAIDITGRLMEVEAKVVVDATGYPAVLRRKAPPEWFMETPPLEDYVLCYREIRKLEEPIEKLYCKIYLNQEVSPGGYVWLFPRSSSEVNVGIGVQAGRGLNPIEAFRNYVLNKLIPINSTVLNSGGGIAPTRRPLTSLVGKGLVIVGDAACQANPIHGGGMGPSMLAGVLAAETIAEALEMEDVSPRGLWNYPLKFNATYGYKQASLDALRMLLQRLNNEDINWIMKSGIVKAQDILSVSMEAKVKEDLIEKTSKLLRGLSRLSLLTKLRATFKAMTALKQLYLSHPEVPEGLKKWKVEVEKVFSQLKASLS